jgi:hypothetical protein
MLATFSIYVYSRKEGVVGQTIKSLLCTKHYMHPILERREYIKLGSTDRNRDLVK